MIQKCAKCKLWKDVSEFSIYGSGKSQGKYRSYCKACNSAITKEQKKKRKPWEKTYACIQNRRHHKKHHYRKTHPDMKYTITRAQLKELWFRDKAYLMKQPSIHRKNNDKGYTFNNCQYIEYAKHRKIHSIKGKKLPKEWRDNVVKAMKERYAISRIRGL